MQLKKGQFYQHKNDFNYVVCYLGKVEHFESRDEMAILKSFKEAKSLVINTVDFMDMIDDGEFERVDMDGGVKANE